MRFVAASDKLGVVVDYADADGDASLATVTGSVYCVGPDGQAGPSSNYSYSSSLSDGSKGSVTLAYVWCTTPASGSKVVTNATTQVTDKRGNKSAAASGSGSLMY
jgi:hypothetical protein